MWSALETLARPELENIQLNLLTSLLQNLWQNVPFYNLKLRSFNLDKRKIGSLSELRELPFTTKNDLREQYPSGLFAVSPSLIKRYHASSGTKSKPTLVAYTQNDLDLWAELGARSLYAAGARPGDLIHNAYGYGLFTGGLGIHGAIDKLGGICVPASGGRTQHQLTLLADLQASVLCCTPSYALRLAGTLAEMGLKKSILGLKIGVFGAEPWSEPMRQRLEADLGLKAFDIYGLTEIMGPGVASECESRTGLHIWEDHFLPEIIDPRSLEPVADGQEGELVISTLQKEALPLLRYRTGDLATLNRAKCACGRTMVRMTRVRARLDDMLIIRGVNVYPSEIENILLHMVELAPHYQLVLKREMSLDQLTVQVELSEESGENENFKVNTGALAESVKHLLKESLGLTVAVEIMAARSLARSEGKATRLLDLRSESLL